MQIWTYIDQKDLASIDRKSELAKRASMQMRQQKSRSNSRYRRVAQSRAVEGTLEVDDDAPVSLGTDGGAYVQGWIWIDESDVHLEDFGNR